MTKPTRDKDAPARVADTREALIRAALVLFGSHGFDAASTREIAAHAKANIAGITYHFGGKDGLRNACAEWVAERMEAALGPAVGSSDGGPPSPAEAEQRLAGTVDAMVRFLVANPEAGSVAGFVLREQMAQSPAFDILYDRIFRPMHERICALWSHATGWNADAAETRLATLALIGQVVYFRVGRSAVLRRMGWDDVGPREAEQIARTLKMHLAAAVSRAREGQP